MYVLVAFGVWFFFSFVVSFIHFEFISFGTKKADMHKIHTEPDDSAFHFIHTSFDPSIFFNRMRSLHFHSIRTVGLYGSHGTVANVPMFTFGTATAAPAFISIEEHIEHFKFGFSCD